MHLELEVYVGTKQWVTTHSGMQRVLELTKLAIAHAGRMGEYRKRIFIPDER